MPFAFFVFIIKTLIILYIIIYNCTSMSFQNFLEKVRMVGLQTEFNQGLRAAKVKTVPVVLG